jgi:hypothetical protein
MSKYQQGGDFPEPLARVVSRPEKDELAGFDWDAVEAFQQQQDLKEKNVRLRVVRKLAKSRERRGKQG